MAATRAVVRSPDHGSSSSFVRHTLPSARDLVSADEPEFSTEDRKTCIGERTGRSEGVVSAPRIIAVVRADRRSFEILRELHVLRRAA
jgi:hypothetical protein